jgi:O-methyltransferase domain
MKIAIVLRLAIALEETIMSTSKPQPADISPSMQMMRSLWPAAMTVQAIHVAAKLGLADLVADGPRTVTELAADVGAHGPSLGRFLRALTSLGIFAEDPDGRYRQTALSETLRADHPESIRRWAMMLGARFVWAPSGELDLTIRTGHPAFERLYGAQFFKHLAEHQEDAAVFDAAMSSVPAWIAAVVAAYDFARFERIVDVGGGHGALIVGILSANPRVRGVLQDLPGVVAGASAAREGAMVDRCEIVGGDFFESVPSGADAYLLKGIIHDWNDEAAVKILKNCRRAIRAGGTLLLLETVLIPPSSDPASALMDLLMMVLTGGRERTEAEFRSLLGEAGFSLAQVISTPVASIIEACPV